MSSDIEPAAAPQPPTELLRLRGHLDQIDDAMHDLLQQRAGVVADIGRFGQKGAVKIRPGREAAIVRRLLQRHRGPFPAAAVVQVWRELIHGMTMLQGPYALAACDPDPAGGYASLAREHFGAHVPLRSYRTPAQAIGDVSTAAAAAAVLPMPADGEPSAAAWWTALLHKDDPRIHVTARLPFWAPRPDGAAPVEALVVSTVPPDPSGADRTLLGLEVALEHSRARLTQALVAAGFDVRHTIVRRDPGADTGLVLVEVAGFVGDDDKRLASLAASLPRVPVVLGAYAEPIFGPPEPPVGEPP